MKKILIAAVAGLLLVGAGGGWYVFGRANRDPMQQAKAALQKGDNRTAGLELRNAVREQPGNAEAHALLSQFQIAQGDPVAAEKEIKRAAQLSWPKEDADQVLAQSYLKQSKWKEIQSEIPRAGATPAVTAYYLMVHAVAERALDDVTAAKATMAEAEKADPGSTEVQVAAARLALANNERDVAMAKLDRALELDPKRTDALSMKAELVTAAGDRPQAIALLDQAVTATPASAALRLERANLNLAAGQDAKAREDVDAVLAKDPKNPSALYLNLVLLLRQGKFADADVIVQRLDPVLARFPRGLYFKAVAKASVGQSAQAEDSAVAYVARNPNDPDGIRLLARIQMGARRPERAVATLSSAVNAGLKDTETLDLLGRAYVQSGKRAEGEDAFKRASAAAGGSAGGLTRVASSRLQAGDLAGAATDLERSLDIAPSQPGAGQALVGAALALGDLDKAQEALNRLKQQTGETEATYLLGGFIQLARLDRQAALDQFEAGLQKFPDSVTLRFNSAKTLVGMNRAADAEAQLRQILDKNPAATEPLALLVQILTAEKRGPEAIAAAERAHAAAPKDLGILMGQAELYARLNDLPRAFQTLDAAAVDGKPPGPVQFLRARLQVQAGQTDAAKTTFASLIAAEPGNVAAIRDYVQLLTQSKEFDTARRVAQEAVQRNPTNPGFPAMLVSIDLQDKGLDAALSAADRLRADPTTGRESTTLKGDLLLSARRYAEAASAYEQEFKANPSTGLLLRLAAAQRSAGDAPGAEERLKRWQAEHPNDADVAHVLASLDIGAGRYADAERNLQAALAQRPNDAVALNNLAWVYQMRGDKRARQVAQRAYMIAPTPESADTLAWVLVSQGDAAKALPILQSVAAARPANPSIKYHLAVALKDLNRKDEALSVLRPLVESSANFDEKPAAQKLVADLSKANP
jgi:putative PEP-CTERM system TPR-repeat lipoprotein